MQRRRSVRQWIAGILKIQEHVDQQRDMRNERHGYERGWTACEKAMQERWPSVFGEKPVYIPVASVQFLAPPPQVASYEPPEKHTDGIRPVRPTAKLLPLENVIGPHQTQSLPAVDPATGRYVEGDHRLMRKAARFWQSQREAGQ